VTEQEYTDIPLAPRPHIVICADMGDEQYGVFVCEADILLAALGHAVLKEEISPEEARRIWAPYREYDEGPYSPDTWADYDLEESFGFPLISSEADDLPATEVFISEIRNLDLPDVDIDDYMGRPFSYGQEDYVRGWSGIEAIDKALGDRYCILLNTELRYSLNWESTLDDARKLIRDLRNVAGLRAWR
jgi:hypothetical protein